MLSNVYRADLVVNFDVMPLFRKVSIPDSVTIIKESLDGADLIGKLLMSTYLEF